MRLQAPIDPRPAQREQAAFTFTELLVVLGVVAVLVLLSVTARAHSQPSSDRAGCANNLRRLMQAWQMYADDYSGRLMANISSSSYPPPWVSGFLDFSPGNPDNMNTSNLTSASRAAIGPYVNSTSLVRCPADPTTMVLGGVPKLRVRSYSMNGYVGPTDFIWSPGFQVITKMVEVSQPDRIFVLLEEHTGSINDSKFVTNLGSVGASATMVSFPGYFHLGGANLGMADGHVDYWQWDDPRTMPPMTGASIVLNIGSPNNPDVARLQAAASYRQ